MKLKTRKALSLVLALVFIIALLPTFALAEGNTIEYADETYTLLNSSRVRPVTIPGVTATQADGSLIWTTSIPTDLDDLKVWQDQTSGAGSTATYVYAGFYVTAPDGAVKVKCTSDYVNDNKWYGPYTVSPVEENWDQNWNPIANETALNSGTFTLFSSGREYIYMYKWYDSEDKLISQEYLKVTRNIASGGGTGIGRSEVAANRISLTSGQTGVSLDGKKIVLDPSYAGTSVSLDISAPSGATYTHYFRYEAEQTPQPLSGGKAVMVVPINSGSPREELIEWYTDKDTAASFEKATITIEKLEAVAKIGDTLYATLAAAVTAAQADDTIVLLKDVTLTSTLEISAGKSITLDLNGFSITSSISTAIKISDGTLNVTGTGQILASGEAFRVAGEKIIPPATSSKHPKVIVGKNVEVISDTDCCVFIYGANSTADIYGSLTSKGEYATIQGNGNATSAGTTINIYPEASVIATAENGFAMYIPEQGLLNITGGTIKGASGIEVKSGTVNISGGTIIATATATTHIKNNNGTSTSGYAFALVNNNAYVPGANATITGGQFTGPVAIVYDDPGENASISVSGGYFTSDPSAYVASGYIAQTTTEAGYNFEVVVKQSEAKPAPAATEVKPAETTGKTTEVATAMEAATNAMSTAGGGSVSTSGLDAAAGKVVQTETTTPAQGKTELEKEITVQPSDTVSIFVQPLIDVQVVDATLTGGNITEIAYDIKAFTEVIATTATTAGDIATTGDGKNAVVMPNSKQPLTVATPVVVTIPLPTTGADFAETVQVKHVKDNGETYYYLGTVADNKLTFTVTHGFSAFTVQAADTRKISATFDSGTTPIVYDITYINSAFPTAAKSGYSFRGYTITEGDRIIEGYHKVLTKALWDEILTGKADGSTTNIIATSVFSPIIDDDPTTGGGGSAVVSYAVTLNQSTGGTIKADRTTATAGTTVNLTVELTDGYALTGVTARTAAGATVAVTGTASGWSFTMPAAAVTVTAAFEVDDHATIPFTDVKDTDWFYGAVEYVYGNRLMDGTSATTFSPSVSLTREQLAAIVYRYAQNAELDTTQGGMAVREFSDYDSISSWAGEAVAWCVNAGILNGMDGNRLAPQATITREQFAAILYRFAKYAKFDTTQGGMAIREFSDYDAIADWAMEACTWCVNAGLMQGSAGAFMPEGLTSRAECAAMISRFDALKK